MAISRDDAGLAGGAWRNAQNLGAHTYVCGFCGDRVSSEKGYAAGAANDGSGTPIAFVRICPSCQGPTFFSRTRKRVPGSAPGNPVSRLPRDIAQLYAEARAGSAAGAYTGAVLLCRKLLMNIAVAQGADEGKKFVYYVEYLADKGYVPPNGKGWVDYIRTRGNEATHEIELMTEGDAVALVTLVEMLLKFIYEFPGLVPPDKS